MKPERILTLDISTKTGYCSAVSSKEGLQLEEYGQIPKIDCPELPYPGSYVEWACLCYDAIEALFEKYAPDVLVIEETAANSKSSHSQKILEFIHFLVAKLIKDTGIKSVYFQTGEWRKLVESKMNDGERKRNKEIKKYKKERGTRLCRDIKTGKVIGKITKKHVAIRRVKELFGIDLKIGQNDTADSLLITMAYHLKRSKRNL